MKSKIYLDTSVFSALLDDRMPERQSLTKGFWDCRAEFDVSTSELGRQELAQTPDPVHRDELFALLKELTVFPLSSEMEDLASHYIEAGVFSPSTYYDALHVAAAVLTRQDILLSWNFQHLVNRLRRARVNTLNLEYGLPSLKSSLPRSCKGDCRNEILRL